MFFQQRQYAPGTVLHMWSDGGSHLKCFIGLYLERQAAADNGVSEYVRSWFAPHHGHGAADAHAGVLKRALRQKIKATGRGITSANEVASVANTLKHTTAVVLSKQPELLLPHEGVPELRGIRKLFDIGFNADGSLSCCTESGGVAIKRHFTFANPEKLAPAWVIAPAPPAQPLKINLQRIFPSTPMQHASASTTGVQKRVRSGHTACQHQGMNSILLSIIGSSWHALFFADLILQMCVQLNSCSLKSILDVLKVSHIIVFIIAYLENNTHMTISCLRSDESAPASSATTAPTMG